MTINHPIRRHLARLCSEATITRVVDPILADIRWERRPRWIGYLALARALALHSIVSIPDVLTRVWCDDGLAVPRMAFWTLTAAILFTLPIIGPTLGGPGGWAVLLLVPQGVAWTLPAVLLLAVPLALRGQAVSARLTRRTIALAIALVAVTFALIVWIAPAANESYREIVTATLTGTTAVASEFPNWSAAPPSRLLAYQIQQQLAFGTAALPFALLGLALSTLSATKRRPWVIGLVAAGSYMFVGFPLELWTSALLLRASSVPPFVLAWAVKLLVLVAAFVLLARRTDRTTFAAAHW
jgi:hypothetical protein